jgi:DNA gyrase subunit A
MGRSAQGVKILSIDKPDFVIGVDRIVKENPEAAVRDAAAVPAGGTGSLFDGLDDGDGESGETTEPAESSDSERK